jgi:hypothetical protein
MGALGCVPLVAADAGGAERTGRTKIEGIIRKRMALRIILLARFIVANTSFPARTHDHSLLDSNIHLWFGEGYHVLLQLR